MFRLESHINNDKVSLQINTSLSLVSQVMHLGRKSDYMAFQLKERDWISLARTASMFIKQVTPAYSG